MLLGMFITFGSEKLSVQNKRSSNILNPVINLVESNFNTFFLVSTKTTVVKYCFV